MQRTVRNLSLQLLTAAAVLMTGCVVDKDNGDQPEATSQAPTTEVAPAPAPQPPPLEIEVNLAQRRLNVIQNGTNVGSHPVAVGSAEWPTPTGEWTISQVVFNPRWVPPENESWAKDEKIAEPGAPENPLGVVQLVYSPPNSIHGTKEPESLGKAVSHGSIRVSNEVGVELAKQVMQAGGAQRDDAWVQDALSKKTERKEVAIPNPVPIRVISGT